MNTKTELKRELGKYMRRTFKNKLLALAMIICGIISVYVDGEISFMLFTLLGGIPLFFTRKRVIE